jgi:hypothetical protein
LVPALLACAGLPIPNVPGGTTPAPAPVVAEPVPAPAPAEPAKPESLFTELDPNEAPPYAKASIQCPAGSMVVRHPSGGRLEVYCTTSSGVRAGPYTEWQGSKLREAGTNEDGKLAGKYTRWDGDRKVGEETYAAGQRDGDFATWDVEGHLLERGRYQAGKKQGKFLENAGEGDAISFAGACYADGAEQWRTTDAGEFVSKSCG